MQPNNLINRNEILKSQIVNLIYALFLVFAIGFLYYMFNVHIEDYKDVSVNVMQVIYVITSIGFWAHFIYLIIIIYEIYSVPYSVINAVILKKKNSDAGYKHEEPYYLYRDLDTNKTEIILEDTDFAIGDRIQIIKTKYTRKVIKVI